MKKLLIFSLLVAGLHCTGQQTQTEKIVCDTVEHYFCNHICLDSTVVSFRVTIIKAGVAWEKVFQGRCGLGWPPVQPGSKMFITDIKSSPKPGVTVRLPSRTYYVR